MNDEQKISFLKAIRNDDDFASDIAKLLAPHILDNIDLDCHDDQCGHLESADIVIVPNDKTNSLYPKYANEITPIAHAFWKKLNPKQRDFESRKDFTQALVDATLNTPKDFKDIESNTEAHYIGSKNIEIMKSVLSHYTDRINANPYIHLVIKAIRQSNTQGL